MSQDHTTRLIINGMPVDQAVVKARLFETTENRLIARGVDVQSNAHSFFVPGRIEFLGKHTDYAGGRSLICAVDRGFCITAVPRADAVVSVLGDTPGDDLTFNLNPELMPVAGHWSNYPMTVGRRVARNFPGPLHGADIALTSDLPASSGLSSSSALIIAFFLCLSAVNRLEDRPEYRSNIKNKIDLAAYLGTIENGQTFGTLVGDRGVGTFGGSEDHTAILLSRPGELSQYSFCPTRFERYVPLPTDYNLVIGVSGVVAEKTGAAMHAYNNVSLLTRATLEQWREKTGRYDATLAAAILENGDTVRASLTRQDLIDRLDQFVAESIEILPAAGDALIGGRLSELGTLVARSQELAERWLKNQVPQTVFLANSGCDCGAVAASSFGAGFGGSVWAMVPKSQVEAFTDSWRAQYQLAFPEAAQRSAFFTAAAGVAAFQL